MTSLINEYQRKVKNSNSNEYIGYYPVTITPITEAAKMKFARELKDESEGNVSKSGRLFSASEMASVVKNFLTKEKSKASPTFTKQIKIHYKEHANEFENKTHYKAAAETMFAKDFNRNGWMIGLHECSIEIGDFVPYEPKKKPSFEDIQDLRRLKK